MIDQACKITVNPDMKAQHRNLDSNTAVESHLCSDHHTSVFGKSWSVYRRLSAAVRPRTLSCMTSGSQVVQQASAGNRNTLDRLKQLQSIDEEVQEFVDRETFRQRLHRTFADDIYMGCTEQRKELEYYTRLIMGTLGVFGIVKGLIEGKDKFKEINKTTMFASKYMGFKRQTNTMVKHAIEKGARFWFMGTGYCLCFIGIYQLVEIYTNKSSWYSIGLGYGLTGSLSRIRVGPRAMGAAFIIGMFMGSAAGYFVLKVKWYHNETQQEKNFNAVKAYITERKKFNIPVRPCGSNEDDVDTD